MNNTGFDLPQQEAAKLDSLRDQLSSTPNFGSTIGFLRSNPWAAAGLLGAVGILSWLFLRARS